MNCKRANTLGRVEVKEGEGEEREKNFFPYPPLPVSFYRRNAKPKSRYFYFSQFFLSGDKIREGDHGITNINKELSLA